MRVLIVSREYPPASEGGISRRLSNLVPMLMNRGVDVGVVCFEGSSLAGEKVHSLGARSRILYTHAGEPSLGDVTLVLTDIWRLDRYASSILSSGRYDLVQIEEPVFGPFTSSTVPRVVTTHTTQLGEFNALRGVFNSARQVKRLAFSGSIGWVFERLCLRDADLVVAVAPSIRAELQRSYGMPEEKIRVIPNGVDVPEVLHKAEAKEKIGVNNLLFVYAGRLIDRKRVGDFLKALKTLREDGFKDFSALIVGSGPVRGVLADLVRRLELTDCVKFTGYVDDHVFFNFLEAADVFVLPSCYEGLPISVMEAMAYGCLPVVANIAQIQGIVRRGENGITFPVGDVRGLSKALYEVATDDKLRTSISSTARKDAIGFSWSTAVNGYLQVYDAVLDNYHRGRSQIR